MRTFVPGIQYLRGLAALFVVVDHAASMIAFPAYLGTSPWPALEMGRIGVDLFFVISGFIIAIVSLNPDGTHVAIGDFYRRRFVRIVPFLWVCILAYAGLRMFGRGRFEAAPYLRAAFLWPVGELRPQVVWTLRHEFLFYSLFAFSFLGTARRPWILLAWLLSPILLAAADRVAPVLSSAQSERDLLEFFASPVNVEFGAGLLLGLIYLRQNGRTRVQVPFGLAMIATAAILEFAFAAYIQTDQRLLSRVILMTFSSGVLWLAVSVKTEDGFFPRFAGLLGDASYAIYLTHSLVILALLELWVHLHLSFGPWTMEIALTIVSVVAGVAAHLWVERPLLRSLSRWSSGHAPTRSPATAPTSSAS